MKKLNYFLALVALALTMPAIQAQDGPYLEALYDVEYTPDQIYAVNATILPVLFQQSTEAVPRPLVLDIYEPVGDDNGPRPVMLVFHTGNFLPFPQNNGTGGTIRDSTVVEVCTRLAQRGYVAAAVDYRLGWNPVDPSQDIRKFFLINAAYRGVQDARTAARYMRKLAVDGDNPYNIDVDKIGTWGIGTGGYIVAATATLDEYAEVAIPKFSIDLGAGPMPMVIEGINGNIFGTSVGIVPPGYPVLPAGDTLCYINHDVYEDGSQISSDIAFTVNNGGALGDISWLDENVAPWVSFHVPNDPFAPYTEGTLTVPGTGDPNDPSDDFAVVEVSGSYNIQAEMNALGFNDIFNNIPDGIEDYSDVADSRNDGLEGLFPMPNDQNSSAPWDFYADDIPTIPPNPLPNPDLARTYWDTIFAYVSPRACLALNLQCNGITDVEIVPARDVQLTVTPNPASREMLVAVDPEYTMINIEVFDMNGRQVQSHTGIDRAQYRIDRGALTQGMYFLKIRLDDGIVVQKVMFD